MASIREIAQSNLDIARAGIGWIALWRIGRGWGAESFWPEYDEWSRCLRFDEYDEKRLREILKEDPDAIIVNSYTHNLGGLGDLQREDLARALRWQYSLQNSRVADSFR